MFYLGMFISAHRTNISLDAQSKYEEEADFK